MLSTNTKTVLTISVGHFVHDIFTSIIPAIAFLLKDRFHLSYLELTLIIIISKLPGLFNPFLSTVADKIGPKYFVILPPLITAICITMIGQVFSFPLLLLLLFLAGISAQAFHVPAPVLIKNFSTDNAGRNMSFFMMGGESARTIGPIIIMSFLAYYTLEQIWWLLPIAIICSLALYHILAKIPPTHLVHHQSISIKKSFKILLHEKKLIYTILAVSICKGFTASTLAALLSTFLKEQGVSSFLSGSSLSLFSFAGLLGVSISGKLSDIVGREKTILFYLLLAPISLLLFSQSSAILLAPALFLVGLIATSITPVTMTYVQEMAQTIPSFANGIYMTANFMLTSLIVLLTGKFADLWGISTALTTSSILAASGLLIILFFPLGDFEQTKTNI